MTEYRAHCNFSIEFANGGGLKGEGFRLDLPGPDVNEAQIGELLVGHLGLALVGSVQLSELRIVEEPHRGSRGIDAAQSAATAALRQGRVVDLSHHIRQGLVTYPGLPEPRITPHLTREQSRASYAPGTEFQIDVITLAGNTGTYLDAPYHRYASGADLAGLDLATLVDLPAEVFHLTDTVAADSRGIQGVTLADRDLAGSAVLLHTGWDRHFATPDYALGAPYLSGSGARLLAEAGVALVGIDSINIDDIESGGRRPAHSILLEAGVHVVEHLTNLDQVPARGARFTATPPAIEGLGTFPVRAFAVVS